MTAPLRIGPEPTEVPSDDSNAFEIPGPAPTALDPASVLADVAADLAESEDKTFITIPVPARPDYLLTFNTDIAYDDLRAWIRKARDDKKNPTDPHMLRLAFAVLSNKNVGFRYKDNEVQAKDNRAFTLSHPEFRELMKADISGSVPAAIRKFYRFDGHIIQVMQKVLEEAGYTDIDLDGDDNPLTK